MDTMSEQWRLFLSFGFGFITHTTFKASISPTIFLLCSPIILVLTALVTSPLNSILLLTGFFFSVVTYRAFLSPLNAFPGPFTYRLTNLWVLVQSALDDYPHKIQDELFNRYQSDWVRIGPSTLICRDPEAIRTICGTSKALISRIIISVANVKLFDQMAGSKRDEFRFFSTNLLNHSVFLHREYYEGAFKPKGEGSLLLERGNEIHSKRRQVK
jgi:hypothetical protein